MMSVTFERSPQEEFDLYLAKTDHLPQLLRIARRLTGSAEVAEDIVQDALVSAFQARGFPQDTEGRKRYLTRSVVNGSHNFYRRQQRHPELPLLDVLPSSIDEDEEMIRRLNKEEVWKAIAQVESEPFRVVLILFYFEDKGQDEISEIVGTPPANVRKRLFHARAELRKIFLASLLCT